MKLTYDIIKQNLEIYQKAKEILPSISQYENDEISYSSMRSLNLSSFADFYDFAKRVKHSGFSIIMEDMTWRKLKPILIEKTNNPRFKKYISNRTQKDFNSLLSDAETYDRLLNGRWERKPKIGRRGRIGQGQRSHENLEALTSAIFPIINYVIQHEIDVFSSIRLGCIDISSFIMQSPYQNDLKWFTSTNLTLYNIPHREIEVTNKLINQFVNILEDLKIDHRKLNIDYITDTISERLRKGMTVPNGTNVRCLTDLFNGLGKKIYTKDSVYNVQGSYVSGGSLMIYIKNDLGTSHYMKYTNFEDMSLHRDNLLGSLFGD